MSIDRTKIAKIWNQIIGQSPGGRPDWGFVESHRARFSDAEWKVVQSLFELAADNAERQERVRQEELGREAERLCKEEVRKRKTAELERKIEAALQNGNLRDADAFFSRECTHMSVEECLEVCRRYVLAKTGKTLAVHEVKEFCSLRGSPEERLTEMKHRRRERLEIEQEEVQKKERQRSQDVSGFISALQNMYFKHFHHVTDEANWQSILDADGLLSLEQLHRKGCVPVYSCSDSSSKVHDLRKESAKYVRLWLYASLGQKTHPQTLLKARKEHRIVNPVHLEISMECLWKEGCMVSDRNALEGRANVLPVEQWRDAIDLELFRRIASGLGLWDMTEEEKKKAEAEILIPSHIPRSMIRRCS